MSKIELFMRMLEVLTPAEANADSLTMNMVTAKRCLKHGYLDVAFIEIIQRAAKVFFLGCVTRLWAQGLNHGT